MALPYSEKDLGVATGVVFAAAAGRGRGRGAFASVGLSLERYLAAEEADFASSEERWRRDAEGVSDARVRRFGFSSRDDFRDALARALAFNIATTEATSERTLRETLVWVRDKAQRFCPGAADAPLVECGAAGGDLVAFMQALSLEQLLAVGW